MRTITPLKSTASLMAIALALAAPAAAETAQPGLLFHMSADKSPTADFAKGEAVPNFLYGAKVVPTGVKGGALQTENDNVLSWLAPGNIYAQRGTLSFFWRSRTPVGRAPFVLFRVGYADHTSWDMVWLRIDYNGHGFDAFVTDANLARTRVSFKLDQLPAPDAWTHIAFSWDENVGVRLYVNGKEAARQDIKAVYDAGLDQFGTAARAVSPHQVMSRYNFMRGSDYDELKIYDHMLSPAEIAALSENETPETTAFVPSLADPAVKAEWNLRYGWNRPGDGPAALTAPVTAIRKVEFSDAKDIKEFMYKATDGIAETTWPGVYNRSRLPGRNDYFQLPDWNVYVDGGKTLTLTLPDEPWNHVEIQGAAYGRLTFAQDAKAKPVEIAVRAKDQERTWNQFAQERKGGILAFDNIAQETPIQEIAAYDIRAGAIPKGTVTQTYFVRADAAVDSPDLDELKGFIVGRFPAAEREMAMAIPVGPDTRPKAADDGPKLPLVHVLIPYEYGAAPAGLKLYRSWGYGWENMHDGLDGIAVTIPALNVQPTENGLYPLNIQVKDPLWPARNMLDVTVAVKPGQARTVWLDLRDRILPNKSFYLTFAGGGDGLSAKTLDGMKIELVFKDRKDALKEHIADRFQQVRDNWGFLVEEHTSSKREALYRRVVADIGDWLRVDPDNKIAREYWHDITFGNQDDLPYAQPTPPKGEPLWAFRQLEDLKNVRRFVNWWIDNRQVDYGDFGGGLSDDSDLVEQWPGLALMGVDSEKVRVSQMRVADAIYRNGMFTNGLSTIMADELHSYEEGINTNSEAMYLNYGDPKVVERLMTTVAAYDRIASVNPAGHLHINTNWFSGADSFREGPWEWSKYYSYLVLHPGILMGDFNRDPTSMKYVAGLADGLLAHGKQDKTGGWTYPDEINWRTDATHGTLPAGSPPMQLFWAAWRWTGDAKYLTPILSSIERAGAGFEVTTGGTRVPLAKINFKGLANLNENLMGVLGKDGVWGQEALKRTANGGGDSLDKFLAWQVSGDKQQLADLYGEEMRKAATTMYTQTEGHWWSDRVDVDNRLLQRTRLGGVALARNNIYPGNTVSWKFANPDGATNVAILVPDPARNRFKVIGYNVTGKPIRATMTGWNVDAGMWDVKSGPGNDKDEIAGAAQTKSIEFEKSMSFEVEFAPRKTTVYEFALKTPGAPTSERPDLGIGIDDVKVENGVVTVTVHSLGAKPAPAGAVRLTDAKGKTAAEVPTPELAAPTDLKPHTAEVKLTVPAGFAIKGASVRVELPGVKEITQVNNVVKLP